MKKMRVLKTGANTAGFNMALDEAILAQIAEGKSPSSLRFYSWSPPACSIGYFQDLGEELDLERCQKLGINYVRRMTGGGAVFHENEVTYSFFVPATDGVLPLDMLESYKAVSLGIIKGLGKLGLEIKFESLNDLCCQGKKISGNAQTRKKGVILQHGTILINIDVEKMFSVLLVPNEKIRDKMISNVKERVTSVENCLGRSISNEEIEKALIKGFKEAFPEFQFYLGEATKEELTLANKLAKEKYKSDEWNFRRNC